MYRYRLLAFFSYHHNFLAGFSYFQKLTTEVGNTTASSLRSVFPCVFTWIKRFACCALFTGI